MAQVLVPELQYSDIVIMDNVSSDNPFEKAFSRLKVMLRKVSERKVDGLRDMIGRLVDIFQPAECANHLKSYDYEPK